ncbi:MAG: SpoIIE family protein phosphatase [Oscillospiraceae bacterium]|nr:SpoIIE family protein phosphatase [Oscillospiraceae bacterium]
MTATRLKRKKLYIKNKKVWISAFAAIKEKPLILLCIMSLSAVESNSFLCVMPLVIMQMCTDRTAMYLCAGASVAYCLSTLLHTAFYVPCISFVLVYLLGDYMLPAGKIKPVWFAASVFAICKIYVLTFGYQGVYFAAAAVETAALMLLPGTVYEGFKLLKNCREKLLPVQLFEASAALLLVAGALSGADIYGFNLPVCFLFSASVYYIAKENIPLSLAAFICMSVVVCQDKNFSFLFAGFMVIYLGSSTLITKGEKGYVCTALLALAVSLLFITKFNSFVFLTVTASSLCAVFIADRYISFAHKENDAVMVGEKDYIQLTQQIDKLNRCFNFLGHTVIDISNLMTKENIPKDVADTVAEKVCRKCRNHTECWQDNYSHTQGQFSRFASDMQKGAGADFDSLFLSRCDKAEQLRQEFMAANRLENAKQLVYRSGRHNQKILQNQFLIISQVLGDITRQAASAGIVNAAYTYTLNNFLISMGKRVQHCTCYQNRARCVIAASESFTDDETERIRIKLENTYGEKFVQSEKTSGENSVVYTFVQMPRYSCEFGTAGKSRYSISGDSCEFFQRGETAFAVLADGMGTGSFASAESRTALTMLKNLLMSEVKPETAIEITNTAINLKGTGQSCVALDVLSVDCYSGRCELYKAGGAASAVIDRGRINRLYSESLPIGILKETKIAKSEFVLENGGIVAVVSDGVQMDEEMLCRINLVKDKLSAEETARMLTDKADGTDDATAGVIRLIRV